jgi:hypothetical protein
MAWSLHHWGKAWTQVLRKVLQRRDLTAPGMLGDVAALPTQR